MCSRATLHRLAESLPEQDLTTGRALAAAASPSAAPRAVVAGVCQRRPANSGALRMTAFGKPARGRRRDLSLLAAGDGAPAWPSMARRV
jgi:hypothetical protein